MSAPQPPALGLPLRKPLWRISIVSHGHGRSVARVLLGLYEANPDIAVHFVVTINVAESLDWVIELPDGLKQQLQIKCNSHPQSFALNHNLALADGDEPFLIAADPELVAPFPSLQPLHDGLQAQGAGILAPQALDEAGNPEDNGRMLPRPVAMLLRNLQRRRDQRPGAIYAAKGTKQVAWLAGYFLACKRELWRELGGFDTKFRMYCEDVDLGLRCWLTGRRVELLGELRVGHPARRATFTDFKHLKWHVQSLLRLWLSAVYRQYRRAQRRTEVPQ